jgi:CBS domain containing-hemolysin-like protein
LVCYDFHSTISYDEEDVMFAIKLNLFSIGTIIVPIHIELVPKPICIPNIVMAEPILKQVAKPISVSCEISYTT